jgi:hypothetical protein
MPATYFWTSTSSTNPSTGANWTKSDGTTGTAPTTGDTAIIQPVPGSTLADIAATDMHLVVLASLVYKFPSNVAGPKIGSAGYGGYWQIAATAHDVTGGGRIKIDFGTNQTTGTSNQTTASADSGQEAIRYIGSHASNSFTCTGGTIGIATNSAGETATAATLNANGGTINASSGVTITNVNATSRGTPSTATAPSPERSRPTKPPSRPSTGPGLSRR